MTPSFIGQYEIIGILGEGGMGQVLHAMDRKLGQEVALKVISPALLGSSSVAQRSQRELQALIALRGHPNVVTVYDYVPEPFAIVMEYLKGETLAQRIQAARGPLPASSIFPMAKAVLSALQYAHERGLLHRDVKPANVMLVGYGTQEVVKVMDFGLAGFIGGGSTLTHTRTRMGTPAYMAPEQHLGRGADERTDIYAFGVMLFEMCTGRQPFPESLGSDYQIAQAHIERPMPSACGLNPSLPYGWDVLIGRCTQKEQTNRYANCGEVLADLERLRRGEPMGAQKAGATQAPRWESGGGAQVRQPTAPTRLEQDLRESPSFGTDERRSKLPWIVTAVVLAGIALAVGALALTSGRKSQRYDDQRKELKKVEGRSESRGEKKGESVHVAGNALEPKKEEPKPAEPRLEPELPRPEEPRPEEKPAEPRAEEPSSQQQGAHEPRPEAEPPQPQRPTHEEARPGGHLVSNGDGTVVDTQRGLAWQVRPTGGHLTWPEAKEHCRDLTLAGGGWRLPTIGELRSLIRGCPGTQAGGGACRIAEDTCLAKSCWSLPCNGCDLGKGPNSHCYWDETLDGDCSYSYWSSSLIDGDENWSWTVSFHYGSVSEEHIKTPGGIYNDSVQARCVRSGQTGARDDAVYGGADRQPARHSPIAPKFDSGDRFEYRPGQWATWTCEDGNMGSCDQLVLRAENSGDVLLRPSRSCDSGNHEGDRSSFDVDGNGTKEVMVHDWACYGACAGHTDDDEVTCAVLTIYGMDRAGAYVQLFRDAYYTRYSEMPAPQIKCENTLCDLLWKGRKVM